MEKKLLTKKTLIKDFGIKREILVCIILCIATTFVLSCSWVSYLGSDHVNKTNTIVSVVFCVLVFLLFVGYFGLNAIKMAFKKLKKINSDLIIEIDQPIDKQSWRSGNSSDDYTDYIVELAHNDNAHVDFDVWDKIKFNQDYYTVIINDVIRLYKVDEYTLDDYLSSCLINYNKYPEKEKEKWE